MQSSLDAERSHLAASRAALRRMRERAERMHASGEAIAGDAYAAETLGTTLLRRIAELADNPDTPLFFGRLDHAGDSDHPGESFHVGRRHVTDEAGNPMVIDWRAPVSRAFYKASVREPMGVAVRRRYGFTGGELTGFEDEHLTAGEELGTASRILTDEIERPRVGPMRDIVATIQPEQDDLVRADLATSLCVQGAPGTGKTAVGLHRAAFLLYNHRERLRKAGVLVVGPNAAFLSYIAAVLPTLGEVEVEQRTIDQVVAHAPVRATDTEAAARVKHDARMADVLLRVLYQRLARPVDALVVPDGSARFRLSAEALKRIIDDARRERLPYATGRERVRARVAAGLRRQAEARGESPSEAWVRRIGRAAPVKEFLDTCWPAATPEGLVASLLGDREALAAAADGILTSDEQDAIAWAEPTTGSRASQRAQASIQRRGSGVGSVSRPARTVKSARFSAADNVLIDEATGLIERATSFGHVVVDEAQDLSAMQCRALARRNEHGSLTVLGDLAQGTTPWAASTWPETLAHLGKSDAAQVALSTGFRVPGSILELANALLPALHVDVPPARSLRRDGTLTVHSVSTMDGEVVEAARRALDYEGSVGVIAADADVAALTATLGAAGLVTGEPGAEARLTIVPASLAKGLEYDHVIVVEPASIVDAEARGLHRLYVVLTRAVSRLVVLHSRPLPAALAVG